MGPFQLHLLPWAVIEQFGGEMFSIIFNDVTSRWPSCSGSLGFSLSQRAEGHPMFEASFSTSCARSLTIQPPCWDASGIIRLITDVIRVHLFMLGVLLSFNGYLKMCSPGSARAQQISTHNCVLMKQLLPYRHTQTLPCLRYRCEQGYTHAHAQNTQNTALSTIQMGACTNTHTNMQNTALSTYNTDGSTHAPAHTLSCLQYRWENTRRHTHKHKHTHTKHCPL